MYIGCKKNIEFTVTSQSVHVSSINTLNMNESNKAPSGKQWNKYENISFTYMSLQALKKRLKKVINQWDKSIGINLFKHTLLRDFWKLRYVQSWGLPPISWSEYTGLMQQWIIFRLNCCASQIKHQIIFTHHLLYNVRNDNFAPIYIVLCLVDKDQSCPLLICSCRLCRFKYGKIFRAMWKEGVFFRNVMGK